MVISKTATVAKPPKLCKVPIRAPHPSWLDPIHITNDNVDGSVNGSVNGPVDIVARE